MDIHLRKFSDIISFGFITIPFSNFAIVFYFYLFNNILYFHICKSDATITSNNICYQKAFYVI